MLRRPFLIQAAVVIATPLLYRLEPRAASRSIILSPDVIPENADGFILRIRHADHEPFRETPFVGIAFGSRLARFDANQVSGALVVHLPSMVTLWRPPPRGGDRLLVALYIGDRPVSAPAYLTVVSAD